MNNVIDRFFKKTQGRTNYVSEIDWKNEKIKISFDSGERLNLKMDDWFDILEVAHRIITMNEELCTTDTN